MAQALHTAMKAIDAMSNFQYSGNPLADQAARKAEKIACCSTIAENMCLPSVKTAAHFSQVLSLSVKRLLQFCDDPEADVRTLADECLNRIIRSMADSNIIKVQFALYNAISKNGSARSLRAALWRFALLSHTIRPMKGKAYVSNLMPCIVAIGRRSEESVLDALSQSLPLILESLGPFMTDKDVKTLLKAFYPNLSSSQAVFRRCAASAILTTCLYCRKPRFFLTYVLRNLIDTLVPLSQTEVNGPLVIGVLGCLRSLLPHIKTPPEPEIESDTCRVDCLVQIYDLCLYYAKFHSDHNMVNAALETLAQLLQSSDDEFVTILTSERGIPSGKIIAPEAIAPASLGQASSVDATLSGDHSESRLALFEPDISDIRPRVEKWIEDTSNTFGEIPEKSLSNLVSWCKGEANSDGTNDLETSLNQSMKLEPVSSLEIESADEERVLQEELNLSDDSSQVTISNVRREGIDIGCVTDAEVPLIYACRYLASSFLLAGSPGRLIADKYFRVSVKSLALTCIGNILRLYPRVLSATLAKASLPLDDRQMIADILLFSDHSDPQIRGNVTMLVGLYLTGVYARCKGSYARMEEFTRNHSPGARTVPLVDLINLLIKGLEDDSTTACRQTLMSLNVCLTDILESDDNRHGILVMNKLLSLVENPYFLVKVQLAKVLSELPYIAVKHVTGNFDFQEKAIEALLSLLADSDPRIRVAASEAIVEIIPSLYYRDPNENEVTRKASRYTEEYFSSIISDPLARKSRPVEYKLMVESLIEPFYSYYAETEIRENRESLEDALSVIVNLLTEKLLVHASKYLAHGCCEALSNLSQVYPTTLYPRAWDCTVAKMPVRREETRTGSFGRTVETNQAVGSTNDVLAPIGKQLLSLATSVLSSSPISHDLSIHRHLILLAGNVISGIAVNVPRPGNGQRENEKNGHSGDSAASLWSVFEDKTINDNLESLFTHVTRLLNIYVHVIDGIEVVPPSVKSSLPSLPSAQSLSPRKKPVPNDKASRERERERGIGPLGKISKELTGNFFPMPHYAKLHDTLKLAHANYSSTLDSEASKMYIALLNACLEVLCQILEIAGSPEASKHAEEILHYLATTLSLSPTKSVQCVRQLLKCIFGTNLSARWAEFEAGRNPDGSLDRHLRRDESRRGGGAGGSGGGGGGGGGLYARCFQKPARHMADTVKAMGNNCRGGNEPEAGWIGGGSTRRREDRKLGSVFKSLTRAGSQKTAVAASVTSFIKIFEPMVIKSLKRYTTTGSVEFQCEVLSLLTQLVQLHVNYCLLDTDKIFIGFVLDQFAFIDEAQIQRTEKLLPRIFSFLVHLSYKNYHSKNIIDVPKIIQLCDGLMASGQPPPSHCIPALVPTVEDIFLARSRATTKSPADQRELETTREVLLSTLLRLIEYPRVIGLLARCVAASRYEEDGNGEEKWRRWSRLSTDAILPLLAAGKIRLEEKNAECSLMRLFSAVSPTVFRPVDPLLKVLFALPPAAEEPLVRLKRWLGTLNIVFLSLISCAKEESMLARLSDLSVYMTDLVRTLGLSESVCPSADPLNATNLQAAEIPPENIFAYFIFRVVDLVGETIRALLESVNHREPLLRNARASASAASSAAPSAEDTRLVHQFAFFLQLCVHVFESGSHCRIANAAVQLLRANETARAPPIERLNSAMLEIADTCPLLTCHWAYLMSLLGYNDASFWSRIMAIEGAVDWTAAFSDIATENRGGKLTEGKNCSVKPLNPSIGINRRIVREAGTVLFCEHVCENLKDAEPLTWLLVNHTVETIELSRESPVRDLVTAAVHRNPAASGLLVQAIAARCLDLSRPGFVKRALRCMEGAHDSQSGAVILALVPRFLETKHLALSRMAAKIASRRAEILLTSSPEDAREQLPREDLLRLMENLRTTGLARKHGTLVSLMNKLSVARYDSSPLELEHCRPFNPSTVKNVQLDRQWFFSQVKLRCCCNASSSLDLPESAKLLSNLELEECDAILGAKEFNLKILAECVRLSVRRALDESPETEERDEAPAGLPPALYRSARRCLLEKVRSVNELVPRPRQIYDPSSTERNPKIIKYASRLSNLIEDTIYRETLFTLIPSVTSYATSLSTMERRFPRDSAVERYDEDLAKFAVLSLETVHWMLELDEKRERTLKPRELELGLVCAEELLKNERISGIFGGESRYAWICSVARVLTRLLDHWSSTSASRRASGQEAVQEGGLRDALRSEETKDNARACLETSALVCWLESNRSDETADPRGLPDFVRSSLESLIVIASRQSLVNTFVLTPPLAWKHGWNATGSGPSGCQLPLVSIESNLLQEVEILQQFIFRVTLLGWTSRLQFEEMWMALLSVLSVSPNEDGAPPPSEEALRSQASGLAVQAITRLLTQTLLLPSPGNPCNGAAIRHPRDPQLALHKRSSQRLLRVQNIITRKYEEALAAGDAGRGAPGSAARLEHLFDRGNIERNPSTDRFTYGQLSIAYLWSMCSLHGDKLSTSVVALKDLRDRALEEARLDLGSCLRFLIELYTRWMAPGADTPPRLLNEVAKSLLSISELFVERAHFQWMLDTCLEISRCHTVENEILHHYLVVAVCKAAAVLAPLDVETLEKVKRSIDLSLKSSFLPARITALHGMLYLLQSAILANCEETMNVVHPLAIKYIQKHIEVQEENGVLGQSEEHQRTMWALVFFLLEHAEDTPPEAEAPAVLELVLTLVTLPNISTDLHRTFVQGLERLIATRSVVGRVAEQIVKVAIERLRQASPLLALPALQLLVTCMYTESADRFNRPETEEPLPDVEPEALVRTIERTSSIFDRIKRGYPTEVRVLCVVLSELLGDFFPPSDILTKVIGEFLSPQQPHQKLLSAVVFRVCERVACNGAQLELLQDWIVFSLPNFIQSLPLAMSTWCLSCFFISASTNPWLRALYPLRSLSEKLAESYLAAMAGFLSTRDPLLNRSIRFPHVQSRIGRYEYEDKKILCIAASDFYRRLSSESQREAFVEGFEAASKELGTPFSDILASF